MSISAGATRDRFQEIERLEEAVAGLGADVSWEIRGEHAVLRSRQSALGLRLEVVPCEDGRVAIRLEGDLATPELEALLRSLPVRGAPVGAGASTHGGADVLGCRV